MVSSTRREMPNWSEIFILHPDTYNFLCFGTISLIFKCGKLVRRSAIFNKFAYWRHPLGWNFIKNNTRQQLFKFYNEALSTNQSIHYTFFEQNFNFYPVFVILISISYTRAADSIIYWYNFYNSLLAWARYLK